MTVKQYKVVSGNPKDDFEKKVNESLKEGWQPLGGVSTVSVIIKIEAVESMGVGFSQAMVKNE